MPGGEPTTPGELAYTGSPLRWLWVAVLVALFIGVVANHEGRRPK